MEYLQIRGRRKTKSQNRISGGQLILRKSRVNTFCLISLLLLIAVFITGLELQLLHSEQLIQRTITESTNYEGFRTLKVTENILTQAKLKAGQFIRHYPEFKAMPYADATGYLTFSMMANSYDLSGRGLVDEKTFRRAIVRLYTNPEFRKLYGYYKAVLADLKCFPVPFAANSEADISYCDSWYQQRTYGGKRKHEGTDLMASNNERGFFPVLSITDGTVEKMGWLDKGGYRIGIRAASGGYFYYAHLASYAPELKQGDTVMAGQLLGFMGDSGYGSEGTVGKFDVHLHVGIYVDTNDGEMSVDPYYILKLLEKNRTVYKAT